MSYKVYFTNQVEAFMVVEADDEEAAIEKAYGLLPRELCAHCSGWGKGYGIDMSPDGWSDGEVLED